VGLLIYDGNQIREKSNNYEKMFQVYFVSDLSDISFDEIISV